MVTGAYQEIEIKLDADPGYVMPDLTRLPGVDSVGVAVEQQLEATYLDTADLRLLGSGSTLRRRTGGDDPGWHLKLRQPTDLDADSRLEIHEPLGEGVEEVPGSLLALVRVQLRGAPVAPVAVISTTRTVRGLFAEDGTALGEVADDLVTARVLDVDGAEPTAWREIEVELAEAGPELLDDARALLLGSGARPAGVNSKIRRALTTVEPVASDPAAELAAGRAAEPAADPRSAAAPRKKGKKNTPPATPVVTVGAVVRAYLAAQAAQLIALDPMVRLDRYDAVHQMRVSTRRLRSALATFRPLFVEDAVTELREELKWLGSDVLGPVRDAEVIRERLLADVDGLPGELVHGPVAGRAREELDAEHAGAHAKAVTDLDGDRYLAMVEALERFVADPPFSARAAGPAEEEMRKLVRKAGRRVQDTANQADGHESGPQRDLYLHEVRIKAKRVRYAAEVARPVVGKPARTVGKAMAGVQETLGIHQDSVVQRQWLSMLADRAFEAGENSFTYGVLHGRIGESAEHDEKLFAVAWVEAKAALAAWPG